MKNRVLACIMIFCISMMLFSGCNSTSGTLFSPSRSQLTPEQVADKHMNAVVQYNGKELMDCWGINYSEKLNDLYDNMRNQLSKDAPLITFSNFKYERLTGAIEQQARESLAQDWLSGKSFQSIGANVTFQYSLSDVQEIGSVYFTTFYDGENGGSNSISVVKTAKGWFVASLDLY